MMQVSNAIAEDYAQMQQQQRLETTVSPPRSPKRPPIVATVKRNKFGTGPFDQIWLNLDCCGLFCAAITYGLHLYGVYATCLVLIPPWMSTVSEDGVRTISPMGHLHRTLFTLIALLAVFAHFKAMTTDPGAVPPDAQPVPEKLEVMEAGNGCDDEFGLSDQNPPKRKGKRLCRRCNAFKPKRAHHCSICRRCIIKMDRKCAKTRSCDLFKLRMSVSYLFLNIFQTTVPGSTIAWALATTSTFCSLSFILV
jgi:hypothetical protein